jgi:hypothetical protein
MKYFVAVVFLSLAVLAGLPAAEPVLASPRALMPREGDYTHMWWAEGFPTRATGAPWQRVIQTGSYAMALDTETLRIPHFGAVSNSLSYTTAARADNQKWQSLPPAELTLSLTANGKTYRCSAGGTWNRVAGPRLIESGRFLQRADVTGLIFTSEDGAKLNVEARFETVAWPDRLALILAAQPGLLPIPAGEACFGRVGGGFGLDGTNHLEFPHSPDLDPEQFTLALWAFVPADCRASEKTFPWLVCKNQHELAEGNYGIVILDGRPQARMNIGGGRENMFVVDGRNQLKYEEWNHLAISYDGNSLRLYVNGEPAGERQIGRKRTPGREGLAFGRRQDNCGDGFHFRGAVDEIRLHHRALTAAEIRDSFRKPEAANAALKPAREWSFRADGSASSGKPGEKWADAAMDISLTAKNGSLRQQWQLSKGQTWSAPEWHEVALALDPVSFQPSEPASTVNVQASELTSGDARPVNYDATRGWHRVSLDGIEPILPPGGKEKQNDAIERVKLVLANPTDREQIARLLFEKTSGGFRQRIGAAVTGVSAMLRDMDGQPTGIPVQLSKNWHTRPEGDVYSGLWFHGLSQVRLPPKAKVELELTLAYGHWGGVAAASHAQLCLIGWGSNQLWDQSALGSWGESICYEPDQAQAQAGILDVRPVMVRSVNNDAQWGWTNNVGGGDFYRLFDPAAKRVFPGRMRTTYARHGPCLTEVTYAGRTGETLEHSATVSLARTDDMVRGIYRLRLDVKKETAFSRFVIFQIGGDTYSYTSERRMALGNENGLVREWDTQWGGDQYKTEPAECKGRIPWISLHEAKENGKGGAMANRGIIIRKWKAVLGGKEAAPWAAERGVKATSTIDIIPPPGVRQFLPGDFVEATIEHVIVPQFAKDYYGPNASLRAALEKDQNTWKMIQREAVGYDRQVTERQGTVERLWPAVHIRADQNGRAEFSLTGGLSHVPVTIADLKDFRRPLLEFCNPDGAWTKVDQSVHGNDFWQTDYEAASKTWALTFNVPCETPGDARVAREYRFNLQVDKP